MKAVIIRSYGGPEVLELVDVPSPAPSAGQIRVSVVAAGVNPVDLQTRSGALAAIMPTRDVIGIGWDVAGTVDAVGEGVTSFAIGDRVIGLSDRLGLAFKGYAEQIVIDADAVAQVPADVDLIAAATLPLNGLTAAQALDQAALRPGQHLLVTGAAGGVGGYVVELAARAGIRVVALGRDQDSDLLAKFGAADVVTSGTDLSASIRGLIRGGVDGVIDAANVGMAAQDAVRTRGVFVSVSGPPPAPLRGIRAETVWIYADGPRLAGLVRLGLALRIADTMPLAEAAQAHRCMEKGGLRGRLVLRP